MSIYQDTAIELEKHPELHSTLDTYTSIADYYCDVLLAFLEETKETWRCNSKTWRSAYMDYHLTMTIHNSAFIEPMQKQVLAKIQLTWDDFKKKKIYKPIQKRTCVSMPH
jgi:hypothetical protein